MTIGEICKREVVFTERTSSVREAAQIMRQRVLANRALHDGNPVVAYEIYLLIQVKRQSSTRSILSP